MFVIELSARKRWRWNLPTRTDTPTNFYEYEWLYTPSSTLVHSLLYIRTLSPPLLLDLTVLPSLPCTFLVTRGTSSIIIRVLTQPHRAPTSHGNELWKGSEQWLVVAIKTSRLWGQAYLFSINDLNCKVLGIMHVLWTNNGWPSLPHYPLPLITHSPSVHSLNSNT